MSNVNLTNYEMNKQAYASENFKFNPGKIASDINVAADDFYWKNCKYVGLLCRERNDYTVFKLSNNQENFQDELKEVLYSRGIVLDVIYDRNKMSDSYQIWIKECRSETIDELTKDFNYKWTPQIWMYMLFDATDWIVEVKE